MADVIELPQHARAATGPEACAALQVLLAQMPHELRAAECFTFRVAMHGRDAVLHGFTTFGGRDG